VFEGTQDSDPRGKNNNMTIAKAPSPSATIRLNSTLQCSRCLGYLQTHNPRGWNV